MLCDFNVFLGNLTSVQCKPIRNCHSKSVLYNKYIQLKNVLKRHMEEAGKMIVSAQFKNWATAVVIYPSSHNK
jgi:hypothetical protein